MYTQLKQQPDNHPTSKKGATQSTTPQYILILPSHKEAKTQTIDGQFSLLPTCMINKAPIGNCDTDALHNPVNGWDCRCFSNATAPLHLHQSTYNCDVMHTL
jgi:hypothetical protein